MEIITYLFTLSFGIITGSFIQIKSNKKGDNTTSKAEIKSIANDEAYKVMKKLFNKLNNDESTKETN